MGSTDPLPAGFQIQFGSLEFQATGNGYHMRLLSRDANVEASAPPPPSPRCRRRSGQRSRQARAERRRTARASSPRRVEAGEPRPAAATDRVASPSANPTACPVREGATASPRFPHGMRSATTISSSSVSSDLAAYEDLPGHHLISIWNLIATSPDELYPDSDSEEYTRGHGDQGWDYSGLRDPEAFRWF